eukprot:scaffold231244_cov22-Tisochrysis_lutea.AAC.1
MYGPAYRRSVPWIRQHTSALAVKAQFAYIEFKVWILTATELPFVLARSSWASPHCSCIGDGSPRQTHQGLPEFLPLPPFLLSLMSKWPTTFPVDNGAGRVTPPDREGGAGRCFWPHLLSAHRQEVRQDSWAQLCRLVNIRIGSVMKSMMQSPKLNKPPLKRNQLFIQQASISHLSMHHILHSSANMRPR